MSPSTLNKYLGFAGVPDRLKTLVPKQISRDEMTKLYLVIPNIKKAEKIVEGISKLDAGLRKRYLQALSQSPKSSHQKLLKRAKNMRIKQNLSIKLSKTNARKLASQSNRNELSPDEFAGKIISDYLKRNRR